MEQEHLHNPFQFQYASSTRKFSLSAKVMAVILVLIFALIPLYEICPESFKANYVYVSDDSSSTLNCPKPLLYPRSLRD